jgi:predicted CoA-binding protein
MTKLTVAILGASTNQEKFGNISVRAHQQQGYTVYPVNPRADEIEGLKCYPSLAEVPVDHLDRISVYLPPKLLHEMLDEVASKSHDQLWLNPGTVNDEVLRKCEQLNLSAIQGCSIVDLGISPSEVV